MKRVELGGEWAVAFHVREDGECVGAILRANVLQADFLCLRAEGQAFALLRIAERLRTAHQGTDIEVLFGPGRTPLDVYRQRTLEEALSHELGVPTQLVLSSLGIRGPMRFITVPPAAREAPGRTS